MDVCETFRIVSVHHIIQYIFKRQGKIHFQTTVLKIPREKLKAFQGIKLTFAGYSITRLKRVANIGALFCVCKLLWFY